MPVEHFSIIILYDSEGRFLLQHRDETKTFLPGHWAFFGGKIQDGETPLQTLKREAKREINFDVKLPKLSVSSMFEHKDRRVYLNIFTEKCEDKSVLKLNDGQDWGWFFPDELKNLKMAQHDRDLVTYTAKWLQALRERPVSIIMLYDDDGRILLQHREKTREFLPDFWAFFGGGIEAGEDPREGAVREAREELAYELQNPELVIESTYQHQDMRVFLFVFAEHCADPLKLSLHEGAEMGWFHAEETHTFKMLPHDRDVLSYVQEWIRWRRK